ncbi:long-chain-fatty-acid--CoA ligase [Calidifontibacillus erzurumensis]|uniref:long-chain-fatty-acid--CoA ligase n=1 Tax=Calidifontibacillus erzurumensis TaxID=2741433 RepID=UPI0035B5159F
MNHVKNRPWLQYYQDTKPLEIPKISIYHLLENTAEKYGNKIAIIYENELITYRQLKSHVDRLAGAWKQMGFQKGARIGLMLANHPHYIICYYAAMALGLTVVQINPMYTPRELYQIAIHSQLSCIVGDPIAVNTIMKVHELYSFTSIILSNACTSQREFQILEELLNYPSPLESPVEVDVHEDVAVIQYTGGTTGDIKGAMLTHFNIIANVIQSYLLYGEKMEFGKEVMLTAIPLYHVYGMTSAMNLPVYIGGTILLIRKFEVNDVLSMIQKYRPTFFPGVPKMYLAFVNHPDISQYDLTCFKFCSCGSAPLPVKVLKRFEELTGAVIGEGFGLTEASPSTHRNPPFAKRKTGSVGIPLPGTDCKIVDDHGMELPPHAIGELLIKGPQVMKGYWRNKEATNAALVNGWLHTGDLATMDEEGYFYIVGRKKEMIIVGGFNIYPKEIEEVLYEHPDILEAAVVGIPHENEGEIVKAYIVEKEGRKVNLAELKNYCQTKLTRYKVPKCFEVRDALPRNTVGKLLKRLLVEEELKKADARKNHNKS